MLVSNIQNNRQNYRTLQQKPLQQNIYTTPNFKGGASATAGAIVETMTAKSKFFQPLEDAWDTATEWLAKNFTAKLMNTEFVAKFANKYENSKLITNHILTIGAATGSGMYMYRTAKIPEDQMDSDRKTVLMTNQALTFGVSTAGAYGLDGALIGWWKKKTNRYAELFSKDEKIIEKMNKFNDQLKAKGLNKLDLVDFVQHSDTLHELGADKKQALALRLKGMDVAKKLLIFTLIYRYIVPVAVTPIANKLGDKYLTYKKERQQKLNA